MANNDSGGEKTEKPTSKRLKDARGKGQIPRTNDLPAWLMMLTATYVFPWTLRTGFDEGGKMFRRMPEVYAGGEGAMLAFLSDALFRAVLITGPVVLLAMVMGVLGQVAQVGWAPKKMKPDFKRLNPFKGIKNMFGPKLFWDSAQNLAKVAVITVLAIEPITTAYTSIYTAGPIPIPASGAIVADVAISLLRSVSIVGLAIAAADYFAAKKRIDKQIKMSKYEVKQEHKQQEGDPQVKGQMRQRQMAMSRNRMMAAVPEADLVMVNPTHLAIAIKYDPMVGSPQVLAKGAGAIADRIRSIAEEGEIPIVRDVPLARTLFRLVDVGESIPIELYEAVARILAFVYALRRKGQAAGTHQSPFVDAHTPLMDVPDRRRQVAERPDADEDATSASTVPMG